MEEEFEIFVLGESDVTVTGGTGSLDGINNGSGANLNGATITLLSNNFLPVSINDNAGDLDFGDSDGSQRLNGAQEIDGILFADNTVVEAEYGFTVSDGTNTFTLIGFNVNNSSPAFATVEGLAFIGGPGGFPPINVPLTVTSTFEGPNFAAADFATPICLTAQTLVETSTGPRAIGDIKAGDLVLTRDNGFQPVRWTGHRTVTAMAGFAPVHVAAGVLGNTRPLAMSQQHRVLVQGWQSELMFGHDCVLVPALHLVDGDRVQVVEGGEVTYVHLLFDRHEMIQTEGCWTESLYLGDMTLRNLLPKARAEVLALFPELASDPQAPAARYPFLRQFEARTLHGQLNARTRRRNARAA